MEKTKTKNFSYEASAGITQLALKVADGILQVSEILHHHKAQTTVQLLSLGSEDKNIRLKQNSKPQLLRRTGATTLMTVERTPLSLMHEVTIVAYQGLPEKKPPTNSVTKSDSKKVTLLLGENTVSIFGQCNEKYVRSFTF